MPRKLIRHRHKKNMREDIDAIIERLQGVRACIALTEMHEDDAEKLSAAVIAQQAFLVDAKNMLDALIHE